MISKFLTPMCLLLTLLFSTTIFAQKETGSINGVITTSEGKSAAAVTVKLKGTNKAALTEEDGDFVISNIKAGDYELEISLVGFQTLLYPVKINEGKMTPVKIQLSVTDKQLEAVIISTTHNKFRPANSPTVAKLPLTYLENPQVYTSVNKELIQQQGLFSADEAMKNTSGVVKIWNATNRVNDGGALYTLRGFQTGASLRNGITGNITTTVDAVNLERLEVVKGPSGALYGSTLVSYGGLINRVTKKPYSRVGGEVTLSGGSYDFSRLSADFNTPLDTAKTALLRINTAYNSIGSFQDNGFSKNFAFDPSFSYKVNDKLTLYLDAEINHLNATVPSIFYINTANIGVNSADKLTVDYKKSYQSDDLAGTSDVANFYGLIDYKLSKNWTSQTNFSTGRNQSTGYGPYFDLDAGNASITRHVWILDGHSNSFQFQQNFIGDFTIGKLRNRLVAGVDVLNQKYDMRIVASNHGYNFDQVSTVGAASNYYNFNKFSVDTFFNSGQAVYPYLSNIYMYSAYASDVLNITDNLMAMVSLRVDHLNSKAIPDPSSGTSSEAFTRTNVSPKFGLVYQVIKDKVSLFGNYMNGFKNPTAPQNKYDAASNTLKPHVFNAEQANQWEGGVKADLWDGRLTGTISYYNIAVKDIVRTDVAHSDAASFVTAYMQDGTQYSKGYEVSLTATPVAGLNLIAGYSHNDSKLDKADASVNGRRPETAGPANTANFWASYTVSAGKGKGLGVGFGGNYASKAYVINNANTGEFYAPSYTLLNAGVFYNLPKFRFSVNVNNLTDKKYWTGYGSMIPQMLRQVIASVSYKF